MHGRWYNDACGTAFALEVLGERWSLLVVRELLLGGRRFSELRASLPGISAKALTERLEGLEAAGVVRRSELERLPGVRLYELTEWGKKSDAAIIELGRWAARSPQHDPTLPLSAVSLMLSFRTMFDARRAAALSLVGVVRVGTESFAVRVADGKLAIRRGRSGAATFTLAAPDARMIASAVYGRAKLAALARLEVHGDEAAARTYVGLFHQPNHLPSHLPNHLPNHLPSHLPSSGRRGRQ
ncbi:MAG: helix-turn-helix domain-containing protein [Polyangia bacterium]